MAKGSGVSAQQKKAEELKRREAQLADCKAIEAAGDRDHSAALDASKKHSALSTHAAAFYTEIDKLAKKQPNMPVTDMTVETINDIIADAKAIVQNDPHLERIKQFVPAGSNPPHSDVLLKTRLVRSALQRGKEGLENAANSAERRSDKATYLGNIIQSIIKDDELPLKDDVEATWGAKSFFDEWFDDDGEFDADSLDSMGVAKFLDEDEDDSVPDSSEGDE